MKTKQDRLNEMVDIITTMVDENECMDIDIKSFIVDMAHTFNLKKKHINLLEDEQFIINEIDNRNYYITQMEDDKDIFTIFSLN